MAKRNRRQTKQQRRQQRLIVIGGAVLTVLVLAAVLLFAGGNNPVAFPDIHGMSFTGDGDQLRVATHTGLVLYEDGSWSKPDLPVNDYMGYSGTEDGFFSSGHPGAGSQLPDPLGLVRSDDQGANLSTIDFLGETDFHVMGASYYNETVFVLNPRANSSLPAGLHYSQDGGATWEASTADGLNAAPFQIAVHPSDDGWVAAATQQGLFVSEDFGATFTLVGNPGIVTVVAFDPNGERLLFGFERLFSYTLNNGQIVELTETPDIDAEEAILYIAVNPLAKGIAFATSDRDIFISSDGGESWMQIAANGASR